MPIEFISAEQRLAAPPRINLCLLGMHGAGKTAQARTLNPATTMFFDGEAGRLALGTWQGTMVDIRKEALRNNLHPFQFAQGLACWLAGPDPSDLDGPYSSMMHDMYLKVLGPTDPIAHIRTIFVDSITVIGRWSFDWARRQPTALSAKTGKLDLLNVYGEHGRQMLRWLSVLQHADRSIIVACALDRHTDEGIDTWSAQIDGRVTGREMPGIFDEVVTLANVPLQLDPNSLEKSETLAFVCTTRNPWGFPAKDRSGCLNTLEPPHLAQLLEKIASGQRLDAQLTTTMPPAVATAAQ